MLTKKERAQKMPEQLQNILWMAEELDFDLPSEKKEKAKQVIGEFLRLTANPLLSHWLYRA